MTEHPISYELLLTDDFRGNQFWRDLADSFSNLNNPIIQNPVEALAQIRSITIEPYFAGLNMQTVGFNVPVLSFSPDEYVRLMDNIGKYVQTRGASIKFIDFIGFIKDIEFVHIPLWADDITDINSLSDTFGTTIWNGGTWFPTPFYDVAYDLDLFTVPEDQIRFLFLVLEPIHLVLRNLIGIFRTSWVEQLNPYAFNIIHDFGYAIRGDVTLQMTPFLFNIQHDFYLASR